MPQDAFTLRYLCSELNELFSGGKVNRIVEPSGDDVVLTIYTGKRTEKLLLSVNPSSPRIGVIIVEPDSPLTAPNFCMLLRKHLLSSTILSIKLVGFDRIVQMDFLTSNEFTDSTVKTLYVELMGRYSNIILTENGRILGGNRGINMFDNGVRPLIVGQAYVFPPVGDKKLPSDNSLIEIFDNADMENLAEIICKNVQGIALSTANEIVIKLQRDLDLSKENFGQKAFNNLNDYLFNVAVNPCVVTKNGAINDVQVYPYDSVDGDRKFFGKLYLAEEFYFSKLQGEKLYRAQKERLASVINTHIKKVKKKMTAITAKMRDASDAETNKIKGELLLANVYKFKGGEKVCELDNYYDGSVMKIMLDEHLSVTKNAEKYYKKYNKQKRTLIALNPQLEQAESELNYLSGVSDEISLCETVDELVMVKQEMLTMGLIVDKQKTAKPKKVTQTFCREYLVDGFVIKAGRNNAENEKLTFTSAKDDIWVHAKDYHSSHVIIECDGHVDVPNNVLTIACEISAYYSKGRLGGKTEVVYTKRKYVKKPTKSKLGFCTYENFKSIIVNPKKHENYLKLV